MSSIQTFCFFQLQGNSYAIDVSFTSGIVVPESVIVVPMAPASILGLFNLRGIPMTIVDLANILTIGSFVSMKQLLIFKTEAVSVAFPIERVDRIEVVSAQKLVAPPVGAHESVAGMIRNENKTHTTILSEQWIFKTLLSTHSVSV